MCPPLLQGGPEWGGHLSSGGPLLTGGSGLPLRPL